MREMRMPTNETHGMRWTKAMWKNGKLVEPAREVPVHVTRILIQDTSKYKPHQGKREMARRRAKLERNAL
jgi:hypothetical protein